jgi:hypothetical protein
MTASGSSLIGIRGATGDDCVVKFVMRPLNVASR